MSSTAVLPSVEVGQRVKQRSANSGAGRRYLAEPSPWRRAHLLVAAALVAGGGVAMFIGWYGISGEETFRDQTGWLVLSIAATVVILLGPALALIAGFRGVRRGQRQIAADLAVRFRLSPRSAQNSAEAQVPITSSARVTLVGLNRVHLLTCPMVEGKAVEALDPARSKDPALRACGVCQP